MKKKLIITAITFLAISLQADCSSYHLLGSNSQTVKKVTQENSIIWDYSKSSWNVSEPQNSLDISRLKCQEDGYILINNDEVNYKIALKKNNIYKIDKGWNYFATPKDGIDIVKSFQNSKDIKFIYVYDKPSKAWAGYSPQEMLEKKIASTRILHLKYIEPNVGFYIYAQKDLIVKVTGTTINKFCQDKIDDGYKLLIATGRDKKAIYNKERTLSVQSRYASHYRRGVYNDSRVAIIFDDVVKNKSTKKLSSYGPASPAVMINYDVKYEDRWFFVFDYFKKECYRGMFPSKKVPPFSSLHKLK